MEDTEQAKYLAKNVRALLEAMPELNANDALARFIDFYIAKSYERSRDEDMKRRVY